MNILTILKYIAALATAATGLVALFKPTAIYGFTGLTVNMASEASAARGISEIRAIFGGLFIALGLAPFFLGETAFKLLGIGYLAIALVRLVSIFLDKSTAQSNLISLAIEIVFGVILIMG